jgi:hypothetical protein
MQRSFGPEALRGVIVIGGSPDLQLNGKPARLAPGAQIRGQNNMLEMPAALTGERLAVHYTLDNLGDVRRVWILTAEEAARQPWPTRPEQAAAWLFDPQTQTWSTR